jgi:voltage-gated potassium channel
MKYNTGLGFMIPLVLGYLMIVIANGIYQRKKMFWYFAIMFIGLSIVGDYFHDAFTVYRITLPIHVLEIFLLVLFKNTFNQGRYKGPTFYQIIVAITFLFAFSYSVIGLYYMRDQFEAIHTITDAVYFTMVTFSTVGYGDIHPITHDAKMFTVSIMVIGIGLFATVITLFASTILENISDKLKNTKGKYHMNNHLVICGYTDITKYLIKNYFNSHTDDLIIIEKNLQANHLNIESENIVNLIDADSFNHDALKKTNLEKSREILILNDNDSDNIMTLLAINNLLKESKITKPKISIKINKEENISIVENIGVDKIVSPTKKMAQMLINDD